MTTPPEQAKAANADSSLEKRQSSNMNTRAQKIAYRKLPWYSLVDLLGHQGVLVEWMNFPSSLLQITQQIAHAVPCSGNRGCYMDVVTHKNGDRIGICTEEIHRCDKRLLTKAETIIYRLNTPELFKKIAEATHCHLQQEVIREQPHLWKIGNINPQADYQFPAYVFLGGISSDIDKVVNMLTAQSDQPFLLISILGSLASHAALQAAQRNKCKLIGLDDLLDVDDNGVVSIKNSAASLVAGWADTGGLSIIGSRNKNASS